MPAHAIVEFRPAAWPVSLSDSFAEADAACAAWNSVEDRTASSESDTERSAAKKHSHVKGGEPDQNCGGLRLDCPDGRILVGAFLVVAESKRLLDFFLVLRLEGLVQVIVD